MLALQRVHNLSTAELGQGDTLGVPSHDVINGA